MDCPADVVKGLHARLREEVQSGCAFEDVWSKLLSDEASLSAYSSAMSALATGSWQEEEGGQVGSRITWCVQTCQEYCQRLSSLLLKDLRRKSHGMPTLIPLPLLPGTPQQVAEQVGKWNCGTPLKMLDVGSCYNPFQTYPQFEVIAIDIAPADKSVMVCDFLSVAIKEHPLSLSSPAVSHKRTVTALQADSFDVIVFSLLLSFLPSPQHRLQFCCKAHQLLVMHGVLLVITPDSSHQNKHAALMKHWKEAIEAIGFHRWKYHKDTHLHCMAFRKTTASRRSYDSVIKNEQYHLHIPQDKPIPPRTSPQSPLQTPNSLPLNSDSHPSHNNSLSQLPFYDQT